MGYLDFKFDIPEKLFQNLYKFEYEFYFMFIYLKIQINYVQFILYRVGTISFICIEKSQKRLLNDRKSIFIKKFKTHFFFTFWESENSKKNPSVPRKVVSFIEKSMSVRGNDN